MADNASGRRGTKPQAGPRPWSLVRRLTGGVALIALLSFGAQAVVLWLWLRPVAAEAAAIAVEQAQQVQVALEAVPPSQRGGLAQRLSSALLTVSQHEPLTPDLPPPVLPPEFAGPLRAVQQEGVQVRAVPRDEVGFSLIFRIPVGDDIWWVSRSLTPPTSALTGTLAVWLALLAVATVGALLVSVRLIARPIGALAEQLSAQQGSSLRPLPVRSDASAELAALVQAFNALAHQVTAAAGARQQLLAGVSHDLRTPLARLRLRAETQCEAPVAEALTADLLALERIVNQFLAYVQGDTAAALGEDAPLAGTVRRTLQPYIDDGQPVTLDLDLHAVAGHEPWAPDLAVQRLLANLVDNALAYGRAPVCVSLRSTSTGSELCVSDGGPGMDDENFQRAQEPFVRLTRTRSELGHCGLGLAIVAQMARQLGGRLHARHGADGRFGITLVLPKSSTHVRSYAT